MPGTGAEAASARAPDFGADGMLASDLWLDQPDAFERVERRRAAGELTDEQAANLARFAADGYFVFRPAIHPSTLEAVAADVERLWREQPPWMAYALHGLLTRFSGADAGRRRPQSRISDLHEFSTAALELYLQPEIHRYVELIFGETPLATQSLFFEWGSQQALHRDPIHVRMTPPAHLAAAWIALEDIEPGSGELVYVPGSHRLPYFAFAPGRHVVDHLHDPPERVREAEAWDLERCREAGLEPVPLLARRGDVLVWHHSLLHGGAPHSRSELTRRSFVVHFTSRANMPELRNRYVDPFVPRREGEPGTESQVYTSRRQHLQRGCYGFVSPLAERLAGELAELRQRAEASARRARDVESEGARRLQEAEAERDLRLRELELDREQRLAEAESELQRNRNEVAAMRASRFWKLRDAWWSLRRAVGLGR